MNQSHNPDWGSQNMNQSHKPDWDSQSMNQSHKYDAIINLPHHVSTRHVPMTPLNRAAQFSPFAALTGHEDALAETARLTEAQPELDESQKELLDERLQLIRAHLAEHPEVTFTYFQPDEHKEGGAYLTATGNVRRILEFERQIVLENGTALPVENLISIEGELFTTR
jgi:hypothetical protein